ncbi:MAG TPA: hypothetical protein VL727_20365 [Puia sp.]|jgi:hypothetical protein|nr:hypothetical protein [Puia sp.]
MYKFQVSAWRKLVFLLLLSACAVTGRAQIYPVQLSTLVSPPYSIYLPDYASPGGEKLRLVLLQRDLTVQGYRVRFDMKVQVNGVTIMQTSRSAMPPPITLQPGIPTVLGGSDLSWYVQPQNLEFGGGYSSSTYEQSRSLPEGPISITFTAYDYIRSDLQVSAAAGSFFYATRDNPPLLNYPACGMQVTPINPQFLNFNWLPQNTSSPNSALQTNYIFSLWAVLPAGYNFQDIVQSTKPLYSVTTQMPTLVYGPGQPALVPGQSYAWRVQAVDMTGRDIFRNNGYSETCNFIYGGDGTQGIVSYPGIQVNAASAGPAQGKVWWTGAGGAPGSGLATSGSGLAASGYDQYRLYYRKVQGNYDWFSVDVNDSMYRIFDLEPSTTYECRLQGHKNGSYGPYTDVINFTTDAPKTIGCTDNTSMLNPYSGRPLAAATPAMNITYGPWDVQLLTVQPLGSPGRFKGTCKVTVPFMGSMTFNAKFDNLAIDDSRNVTAGNIVFLSQGLQSWIDSSIQNQMGGGLYGKVASGTDTTNVTVRVSLANLDHLDVVDSSNGDIKTVTLPDNSTVTVPDGMQELTIKDASGSTYSLDNQGNLTQLSLSDPSLQNFFSNPENVAALNTLAGGVGTVTFKDIPDAKFAFDGWKPFYGQASTILTGQYEKLTGPNGDYYVPQKAIGAGESDLVGLDIDLPDNMDEDSLIFVTGTGTRLIWDPNDYTLNLLGGPAADAQEIYALYPKPGGGYYSLAKLLVSAYEHKDFTAVLVPVVTGDGAVPHIDIQKYSDSLNSIYNKVNIAWTVIPDSAYRNTGWDANGDGKLTMTGSSFLSNTLNGEPAGLVRSYSQQRPVDNSKKYIFVFNTSGGSSGDPGATAGDMPRGTQYGFIFLDQSGDAGQTAVTIAHELGHGQFNLEHTFSGDVALGGQGATKAFPNLMDYQVGSYVHLYKYQWNQVHQPGQVMGIFESDTAGQSQTVGALPASFLNNDKAGYTFVTFAGQYIRLPKSASKFTFGFGISGFNGTIDDVTGVLQSFYLNGEQYNADLSNGVKYIGISSKTVYSDPFTGPAEGTVIMAMPCNTSLVAYKLSAVGLTGYDPNNPARIINEDNFPVVPFSSANGIVSDASGQPVYFTMPPTNSCEYCYTDTVQETVSPYCLKPSMLYVSKIAAIRNAYPVAFGAFTSNDKDWAAPTSATGENGTYDPNTGEINEIQLQWYQELQSDKQMASLMNDPTTQPRYFSRMLKDLRTFVANTVSDNTNFYDTVTVNCNTTVLMQRLTATSDGDCQKITARTRIILIKILTAGTMEEDIEDAILRVMTNTPSSQQNDLLKGLNDGTLLEKLQDGMNDALGAPNYTSYTHLIGKYLSSRAQPSAATLSQSGQVLNYLNKPDGTYILYNPVLTDTSVQIQYASNVPTYTDAQGRTYLGGILNADDPNYNGSITLGAYDYLILYLSDDVVINGTTIYKKSDYPVGVEMTALQFYWLIRMREYSADMQFSLFSANIPLLMVGMGEAGAASSAFRTILAIGDLQMSLQGLFANTGTYKEVYQKYPSVRPYLDTWTKINRYYGVARIVQGGGNLLVNQLGILKSEAKVIAADPTVPENVKKQLDIQVAENENVPEQQEENSTTTAAGQASTPLLDLQQVENLQPLNAGNPAKTYYSISEFNQSSVQIPVPASGNIRNTLVDMMQNGDNGAGGVLSGSKTEAIMDELMRENNFQSLSAKYHGENGIDGLYIRLGEDLQSAEIVYFSEAKQFAQDKLTTAAANGSMFGPAKSVKLSKSNPATGLPQQMTDDWLEYVGGKIASDASLTAEQQAIGRALQNLIRNRPPGTAITKMIIAVDKSTGTIYLGKIN